MTARLWERIEPGYYRLRGTDIHIANMRGTSVKWSGLILETWEVRLEPPPGRARRTGEKGRTQYTCRTMNEAKERAIQWAREEGWM